jgi:hypothetical protein
MTLMLFSTRFNIRGGNQVIIGFSCIHLWHYNSILYVLCKEIKPLFSDIEVIDKDLYIKNNYHIYLAIIGVFTRQCLELPRL